MTPSEQSYREIPLTQECVAIVDASDFDWLNQWKWTAKKGRHGDHYAFRVAFPDGPTRVYVMMHRLILGLNPGDKRQGDHISHNTLDNRRSNLRIATHAQNTRNSKVRYDNKTGKKGVSWHKHRCKWVSRITINGKTISLGYFSSLNDAKAAYDLAAPAIHKEFSSLG